MSATTETLKTPGGDAMTRCEFHGTLCAFPEWSPDRCFCCHASWAKITAPATRVTSRQSFTRAKPGHPAEPITVEDIAYLDGYGEMPLNHIWRHAIDLLRVEAEAARWAARKATKRRVA